MARFYFLTGDINWQQYGGTWYSRRPYHSGAEWTLVEFINRQEATGEKYHDRETGEEHQYVVEARTFDLAWYSPNEIKQAMRCNGSDEFLSELSPRIKELAKIQALASYTGGDVVFTRSGNNARKLLAECKRAAV